MRTRPLVPAPAVIALILVVISLLLGLGQNGVPPTVGTVAAATPTSNPSLTPIPGDERVPATFPTQQGPSIPAARGAAVGERAVANAVHGRADNVRRSRYPVKGEVRIRMHFNRFVGTYVFHCHILAHEDNGMMGIIDVSKDGRLSKATQQTLAKMNREMAGQHMGHT